MKLAIEHTTLYQYRQPVLYSIGQVRLIPRPDPTQTTIEWQLHTPSKHKCAFDHFGNYLCTFSLNKSHWQSSVRSQGIIELHPDQTGWFAIQDTDCPAEVFLTPTQLTTWSEEMLAFAKSAVSAHSAKPFEQRMLALAQAVSEQIAYTKDTTTVSDSAAMAFEKGQGVCQDQAHVMIACLRALQIPARYVSGYRYSDSNPEHASHAWLDAFDSATQRWLSVDPTHIELAKAQHCRLAIAKDYAGAAPLRGVRSAGADEQMQVKVNITRLD